MYVLVAIFFVGNLYKVNIQPYMYTNYDTCNEYKEILHEQLMATKPTEDAKVITFCSQVPIGV